MTDCEVFRQTPVIPLIKNLPILADGEGPMFTHFSFTRKYIRNNLIAPLNATIRIWQYAYPNLTGGEII